MEGKQFLFEEDPLYFTEPNLLEIRGFKESAKPMFFRTFVDFDANFKSDFAPSKQSSQLKPYEDNEGIQINETIVLIWLTEQFVAETVSCAELEDNFHIKCNEDGRYSLSLYMSP